jgi:hypothetical protein
MNSKIGKRSRTLTLWGLFIVFILPLILAAVLYATRSHWSLESDPYGELLNPPLRLETTDYHAIMRLWRVLYITPGCIDNDCELQQAKIASIREATGKDYNRVDAVFAVSTEIPEGLYIMDPDGYIILKYPSDTPGFYILQDLRHLLKVSQIG